MRPSKELYYLNIAREVATRSTCKRSAYGACIVKNDVIVGTGYNGSPRGAVNCLNAECLREGMPSRQRYELCRAVHAEINAIINAPLSVCGARIYIYGFDAMVYHRTGKIIAKPYNQCFPCQMCYRQMVNAGIKEVCLLDMIEAPVVHPLSFFKHVDGV